MMKEYPSMKPALARSLRLRARNSNHIGTSTTSLAIRPLDAASAPVLTQPPASKKMPYDARELLD